MPALPEKRLATKLGVSLGAAFLPERCAALDAFLKRCAAHGALRASPHLAQFLEAGDAAWAAAAGASLPREGLSLAAQREREGLLAPAALRELGRGAAALLTRQPDTADAEHDRVRPARGRERPGSAARAHPLPRSSRSSRHRVCADAPAARLLHRAGGAPVGVPAAVRKTYPAPNQCVASLLCARLRFCAKTPLRCALCALTRACIRAAAELAGALQEFGGAMAALGSGQTGDASSALASLAACCEAHARSGGAKAQALTAAVDAPMRDLVRCGGRSDTPSQAHMSALTHRTRPRSALRSALVPTAARLVACRAPSPRATARTPPTWRWPPTRMRSARAWASSGARMGTFACHVTVPPADVARRLRRSEGGKADVLALGAAEREAASAAALAATARREYDELCERMGSELLRADAQRAAQLGAAARALGAAQRELARDQAAAFALMRVRP